jgi:hypothetical protein
MPTIPIPIPVLAPAIAVVVRGSRTVTTEQLKRAVIAESNDNGYQINLDRKWYGDGATMYGDVEDRRKIWCGLSFASFNVAPGTKIKTATLFLEVFDSSATGADAVTLWAEKKPDSVKPADGNGPTNWEGRRTINRVTGLLFETPGLIQIDITAIVNEVIALREWRGGGRLNLYFKPTAFGGSRGTSFVDRQAYIEVTRQ